MNPAAHFVFLFFILILGGCQTNSVAPPNNPNENLTVSAAVSLKDAFGEIGAAYQGKTGNKVDFNFGASGALQKQIETGAPVDVFAAAGAKQMDELAAANLIDAATRRDFARNTLVLIVPKDTKLNVSKFEYLTEPEVRKIAVGNPQTVPAGQYAAEVLTKMNLQNALQAKLILAENVRQVLDYVARGEVDAGIVYATDAATVQDKVRVAAAADEASHTPILYPIAVVSDSRQKQAAQDFIDFIGGADGQNILRKYGFAAASEK